MNSSTIKFSNEFSYFVCTVCFVLVFACDAMLFVMIDWRTRNFLKIVATSFFTYTTLCVMMTCMIFAMPHSNLVEIVPTIKQILFHHEFTTNLQPKLMDLHYQMTKDNVIGIKCADIYIITNHTNLNSLIMFCLNVILILNLFQDYFSTNL